MPRRTVGSAITIACVAFSLCFSFPLRAQAWRTDADDAGAVFMHGFALAGAAMLSGLDRTITNKTFGGTGLYSAHGAGTLYSRRIGGLGPVVLSGLLVVAGLAGDDERVQRLGEQSFSAIAVSYVITGALKMIVGRERPYVRGNSTTFKPGRGLRNTDYASFPSGHSSAAFALATVLATGTTGMSLTGRRVVGGVAFAAATSVALARVGMGEHWTSDVIAGAAVGVVSGTWVTQKARASRSASSRGAASFSVPLLRLTF